MRIMEAVEQDVLGRDGVLAQLGERGLHDAELGVVDDQAALLALDDGGGVRTGGERHLRQAAKAERQAGGTGERAELTASYTYLVGSVEHVSSLPGLTIRNGPLPLRDPGAGHPSMGTGTGEAGVMFYYSLTVQDVSLTIMGPGRMEFNTFVLLHISFDFSHGLLVNRSASHRRRRARRRPLALPVIPIPLCTAVLGGWRKAHVLTTFRRLFSAPDTSVPGLPGLVRPAPRTSPEHCMTDLPSKTSRADPRVIAIRGAREHNLKNVDVTIPRDQLVVFTGLSGSGKSSLAFDTIYAEGQRRYVECLSAYARQFLEMMQKPDVDQIDGLSPAISIEQKTTSKNPRSTVGTVTEIYDYMRLLWARVGIPYSPATGLPIESQTVSQMVDRVLALPEGTRIYVLAPLVRGRKGEYRKELADLLKKGYQRVKIDGAFHEIGDVKPLDKKFTHDIDVVVDRLVVKGDIGTRLADSLEQSLKLADGLAVIELADSKASGAAANRGRNANAERLIFSEKFACPVSGFTIPEIEPRLFSFNNPFGACPECGGLGLEQHIDADLVIPDKDATLRKGAIAPWSKSSSPYYIQTLEALGKHYRFTLDTKWKDLPKKTQEAILYGSGEDEIKFVYDDGLRGYQTKKPFEGVITNLERRFKETESEWAREDLQKYFTDVPCAACHGARLKPEALCVKIAGKTIADIAELSVRTAGDWVTELPKHLTDKQNEIAGRVLKEIRERLKFLVDVGLDYLTLSPRLRHALRRREPAHPPRLADRLAASPACSMCWTSPPSACTSATTPACSKR